MEKIKLYIELKYVLNRIPVSNIMQIIEDNIHFLGVSNTSEKYFKLLSLNFDHCNEYFADFPIYSRPLSSDKNYFSSYLCKLKIS